MDITNIYNGGGVGVGDFNNDGLIDLFFASNQGKNKIYLNKGHLQFTDVTDKAQIPEDSGWSTGISIIDINNDGLADVFELDMSPEDNYRKKMMMGAARNAQDTRKHKQVPSVYGDGARTPFKATVPTSGKVELNL